MLLVRLPSAPRPFTVQALHPMLRSYKARATASDTPLTQPPEDAVRQPPVGPKRLQPVDSLVQVHLLDRVTEGSTPLTRTVELRH